MSCQQATQFVPLRTTMSMRLVAAASRWSEGAAASSQSEETSGAATLSIRPPCTTRFPADTFSSSTSNVPSPVLTSGADSTSSERMRAVPDGTLISVGPWTSTFCTSGISGALTRS